MEIYLSLFYSSNAPFKVIFHLLEFRKMVLSSLGLYSRLKAFIADTQSGELLSWLPNVPW